MTVWSRDDAIVMEHRHILAYEILVARQEQLISRLDMQGHDEMVPLAKAPLVSMNEVMAFAKARLSYLHK